VRVKAYKLAPKTLKILVEWANAGLISTVGREHCTAADRALIRGFARDLGLIPPDSFYRPVRDAGRPVPQIEATAQLASDPTPQEISRRELVSHGAKTS
jgi:hypothetical protein